MSKSSPPLLQSPLILLRIFRNLSLEDLDSCMRVCRSWNLLITKADRGLWQTLARAEVPESALHDKELFSSSMTYREKLRAFRHAFNPLDASRNTYIRTNGFTVHRQPIAQSTDGIRGKIGHMSGCAAYKIRWKGPLGTVR